MAAQVLGLVKITFMIKLMIQVALRRQQAQEETEARQLGVELLKPGDRAELVMGTEGIMARDRERDNRREQEEKGEAEEDEEREYRREEMATTHSGDKDIRFGLKQKIMILL